MSVFHYEVHQEKPKAVPNDWNYAVYVEGCFGGSYHRVKAKNKIQAEYQVEDEIRGRCNHSVVEVITRGEWEKEDREYRERLKNAPTLTEILSNTTVVKLDKPLPYLIRDCVNPVESL